MSGAKDRIAAALARWPSWAGVGAPVAAALFAAAPALAVLASLSAPLNETVGHVLVTRGFSYAAGTFALCLCVGATAGILGVAAGMLTALCNFPMRRFFSLTLALPLAMPAYIAAYAYADLLGPFGAFEPMARSLAALGLPDIRSFPGAVFVLSMTLYPYAYLASRAAFSSRSSAILDTARTLGAPPVRAAVKLLLPASRPAIAGGVALVLMETAAEFGVADYFGVPTLSVGIFRTWHSFGDLAAASQLASGLLLFALALVAFEAIGRRGRAGDAPRVTSTADRHDLDPIARTAAAAYCAGLLLFGFAAPTIAILAKLDPGIWGYASRGLSSALVNSISIGAAGAFLTLAIAVALAYVGRSTQNPVVKSLIRVATMGYAVPGAVIAIGVLSVFSVFNDLTGINIWVAAGPAALIYAYAVRFLTAGYNVAAGGLAQIDPGYDAAARTLGASATRILTSVHAPLIRPAIFAALIILLVDIMKELPATLILRDFNFETLATRVYRLAGDERLAEAAPDALLLIALSALPIILLNALADRNRP